MEWNGHGSGGMEWTNDVHTCTNWWVGRIADPTQVTCGHPGLAKKNGHEQIFLNFDHRSLQDRYNDFSTREVVQDGEAANTHLR